MRLLERLAVHRRRGGLLRLAWHQVTYCLRFPARMESVTRISLDLQLAKLLPRIKPGIVVDVGAAEAPYRALIASSRLVTVDLTPRRCIDLVSDIHHLACATDAVDSIIATEVLEHCRDPRLAVAELHRCLRPGGGCILTTRFIQPYHPTPRDYYRFTQDSLADLFAPFTSIEILPHGNSLQSLWVILGGTPLRAWLNLLNPVIARIGSTRTLNPCGFLVYAVK